MQLVSSDLVMQTTHPFWSGKLHLDHAWAAFRGQSASNTMHSHAAWQVCVGMSSDISLIDHQDTRFDDAGLIVKPSCLHRLLPLDDALLIFIEPQTRFAQALAAMTLHDHQIISLPDSLSQQLRQTKILSDCIKILPVDTDLRPPLDARLVKVLQYLVQSAETDAIARAAQMAGLSTSRLRTVARQELGIALSDWVAWRKLERAGTALIAGERLTAAAIEGGFADQAHFNRAMRKVFGITPGAMARLIQ